MRAVALTCFQSAPTNRVAVYSSSRNTRDFSRGIRAQKGNLLHRGYNPAMKNKRSARMRTDAVRKMLTCLCETRHVNPHPARKTRERVLKRG